MLPQGPAVSRPSVNYTETAVLPPAAPGNMDEWEKCDLRQKKRHIVCTVLKYATQSIYLKTEIKLIYN